MRPLIKKITAALHGQLKKCIRWLVFMLVLCALFHAVLVVMTQAGKGIGLCAAGGAFVVALLVTFGSWYVVDRQVGTEIVDGDEREYVNAAWHAGLVGMPLMLLEAGFQVAQKPIELIFEDMLLGASALCMLAEEVRLLKITIKLANPEDVGPGRERMVVPAPDPSPPPEDE